MRKKYTITVRPPVGDVMSNTVVADSFDEAVKATAPFVAAKFQIVGVRETVTRSSSPKVSG